MQEGAKEIIQKTSYTSLNIVFFIVRNPCIQSVGYEYDQSCDSMVCTRNLNLPYVKIFAFLLCNMHKYSF